MGHNQNLLRASTELTEVTNNSHLENNTALTSTEHNVLIISPPEQHFTKIQEYSSPSSPKTQTGKFWLKKI